MGKLHTLRRAIERNPSEWYHKHSNFVVLGGFDRGHVKGALFFRNRWRPTTWGNSYRAFVASVLRGLGYSV